MDIETLYQHFLDSSGVCTDTRDISPDCLFFALKGENFNGNLFAQEALDKGAHTVVVDEEAYHQSGGQTFLVHNTILALQELAQFHRKQLNAKIIALTGSNGKTTTKELISSVLSQKYHTVATKGNLNNHIGVPLTLLSLDAETEFGIVEMGANHLGEIKMLSDIAQPDFGYITNFGKAHLEGFGSIEGVVKGKTELYDFLRTHERKVFVNDADPLQMKASQFMDRIVFSSSNSTYPIQLIDATQELLIEFDQTKIQSKLIGAYNFGNIAAAIAMGAYFKIPTVQIKAGVESYMPTNNRSQILTQGSNTILMDAYNANPTSMLAALKNFKTMKGNNKILYLGDMFELGKDTEREHQKIVDLLSADEWGKVFLTGENFFKTSVSQPFISKYRTFEDLKKELENSSPSNATILIKASRGMALERILPLLGD